MTEKKLHWTQTPEGRSRMAAIAREKGLGRKRVTAAARKKISAGLKAMYARRKNGVEAPAPMMADEVPIKVKSGRGFAKERVRAFALAGARVRLEQLDRERVEILMFLKRERP